MNNEAVQWEIAKGHLNAFVAACHQRLNKDEVELTVGEFIATLEGRGLHNSDWTTG